MDSMDYSFHDSSDTSSSGIPNTSWHPASDVSWPPFYSPHSAASSQPSPDLSLLLPYNQEISFAAFGYGFSAHLSASSSPGVPITQQELFYPPTPSHSSPTGPFALSAHAVESASLVPQRDRGIWFQSRTAAALHRHQGESSSSHIQPTASTPQRGQSLTISRRSPPATLRSRYAFSQPSIDTYSSVGWDAPANNLTVNATPAPVSMSPSASDEASVRQTPPLSQTQSEQSSTAFRNPVESRQASQGTYSPSIAIKLPFLKANAVQWLLTHRRLGCTLPCIKLNGDASFNIVICSTEIVLQPAAVEYHLKVHRMLLTNHSVLPHYHPAFHLVALGRIQVETMSNLSAVPGILELTLTDFLCRSG